MYQKYLYRLNSKEVNYLVKKRNALFTACFTILRTPQYPNKKFHQYSINVGVSFHKSSVVRHKLKRIVLHSFYRQLDVVLPIKERYYKFFVSLNKKNIADWQHNYTILSRKDFVFYVDTCVKDFLELAYKKIK